MKKLPLFIAVFLFISILGAYAIKHQVHLSVFGEGPISSFIEDNFNHISDEQKEEQPLIDTTIVGKTAPNFTLDKLRGGKLSLTDYKGKLVMLNFWASWCPPCRAEIPDFIKIQEKYQDKNFTFIGVAIEDKTDVENYIEEIAINYPISYGVEAAYKVSAQYGNPDGALPYTLLISPDQKILAVFSGFLGEERLELVLKEHL